MTRVAPLSVLATVVLLTACGGGGGGGGGSGPEPEGPFWGSYHYLLVERNVMQDRVRSETGQVTANGLGTLVFGDRYVMEEGSPSSPGPRGDMAYVVDAGGQDLVVTEASGRPYEGRISADGLLSCGAVRHAGEDPATLLFLRRATSPSQADLVGTWHMFLWGGSATAPVNATAAEGILTVDAMGAFTVTGYHYNRDAAIDPDPVIGLGEELTVESGGWVVRRLAGLPNARQRGGISEDGSLIFLGPAETSTSFAGATILIRANQASSTGVLEGSYRAAGFESSVAGYGSAGGPMTLNVAGDGTWNATYNFEGVNANNNVSVAGAVNPDGTTDFTLAGLVTTRGAVGSGGRYVAWSGYFTAGAFPVLLFLVR